jgi:hypothetical protein
MWKNIFNCRFWLQFQSLNANVAIAGGKNLPWRSMARRFADIGLRQGKIEFEKIRKLESEKGERRKMDDGRRKREDGRKEDKQDQNGERSKGLSQGLRLCHGNF